jgi:hypothetical protein
VLVVVIAAALHAVREGTTSCCFASTPTAVWALSANRAPFRDHNTAVERFSDPLRGRHRQLQFSDAESGDLVGRHALRHRRPMLGPPLLGGAAGRRVGGDERPTAGSDRGQSRVENRRVRSPKISYLARPAKKVGSIMTVDLNDEERRVLVNLVTREIEGSSYPLSAMVQRYQRIRAKLLGEELAPPGPLPPRSGSH